MEENLDIRLGEIKKRESVRNLPPDQRDRSAVRLLGNANRDRMSIYLSLSTLETAIDWGQKDPDNERGGILLGNKYESVDGPFLEITAFIPAPSAKGSSVELTFTQEAWEEMMRKRDELHAELDVVGWFHTHPGHGVFLSERDLFICRHFFGQPHQIAAVYDSHKKRIGIFGWVGEDKELLDGLWLYAPKTRQGVLNRLAASTGLMKPGETDIDVETGRRTPFTSPEQRRKRRLIRSGTLGGVTITIVTLTIAAGFAVWKAWPVVDGWIDDLIALIRSFLGI